MRKRAMIFSFIFAALLLAVATSCSSPSTDEETAQDSPAKSSPAEATPEPEEAPELSFPLELRGEGTYTILAPNAETGCPSAADVTITLEDDGTLRGTINYKVVEMETEAQPNGGIEPTCSETGISGAFDIRGTHEDGKITAGTPNLTTYLTGEFDASGGSLSGRKDNYGRFDAEDGFTDVDFPELVR